MSDEKLIVKWSKKENDHIIDFPNSPDGGYIQSAFFHETYDFIAREQKSIVKELKKRGYDLETLKFSIKKRSEGEHAKN